MLVLLSGKRKSGKDFVADLISENYSNVKIIRISAPLKKAYADENNLDYQALLTSGKYKEKFRDKMVTWGEEKRQKDSGYFIKLATENISKESL